MTSSQLPLPDVVQRSVAAMLDTTLALAGLPARALSMMSAAEQTLSTVTAAVARMEEMLDRITALLESAEQTTSGASDVVARANAVAGRADGVVTEASRVSSGAAEVVEQASSTTARVGSLLDRYQEPLQALEPTVRRLAETTDPREVDAMVSLVDRLPGVADAIDQDIVPLMRRLDHIAPDLHQLLQVASELNDLVSRLPWWARPRGSDEQT